MKKIPALLMIVLIVLCCGCTNQNTDEQDNDAVKINSSDSVINLQMREPDSLDPVVTLRESVRDVLMIIYEPLFDIDEKFTLRPVLADTYVFNENATVMTLRIKEGVLWHNGQPFTSDDVVYTVNKIKSMPQSSYYLNLESVDRVEKINDYEVVFYLKEPDALFAYSLYFPIQRTNLDITEIPIGTGAFMFEKSDGKSMTLVRNDAWHLGEAKSDGVKILYMRTSLMAQEAFASGKIHAVTKKMLDTENFAIKETQTKHIYPDGLFEFMGFNAKDGIFKDALLRIAASNAINRGELAKIFDTAIASGFPIMPGSSAFAPSFEITDYNLDYAKEVIFSAGWVDLDYDTKPEKVIDDVLCDLSFTLLVSDGDIKRGSAAQKIKENLEAAGFSVNIAFADNEEFNRRVTEGEYDAFLGAVYYDDPYDMSDLLASDGKVNYQGYSSSDMDLALAKFMSATNRDSASVAFSNLQGLYIAHQPVAGLVFRTTYVVTSPAIGGQISPYPYSPYANIAQWTMGENYE